MTEGLTIALAVLVGIAFLAPIVQIAMLLAMLRLARRIESRAWFAVA